LPQDAIVGGIIRNSDAWIASDSFQIEAGDKVVIFALPDSIKQTLEIFS
jgi:trk system potassium uptake protein TrkA